MSGAQKETNWVLPKTGSHIPEAKKDYLRETVRLSLALSSRHSSGGALSLRAALKKAGGVDAEETLSCFESPFVGIPLRVFAHRSAWPHLSGTIKTRCSGALAHIFFELALRRLIPADERMDWTASAPPLASPALHVMLYPPPDAAGWRFESGKITALNGKQKSRSIQLNEDIVTRKTLPGGVRCERAYVELRGGVKLALVDPNPLASLEDHPDRAGNDLNLGGKTVEEWQSGMNAALDLISGYAPDLYKEMTGFLAHVVPVGFLEDRHLSSTYREALGTMYLSLHPEPLILAEAIIHEFQHNKLYLARREDPILLNALHPLYHSPVRPDPRPLWGILLAAHAFLPVAVFHRRLRGKGHAGALESVFERRLYDIDCKNLEAVKTLRAHGKWTELGGDVFEELKELNLRHVAEWKKRGVSVRTSGAHEN